MPPKKKPAAKKPKEKKKIIVIPPDSTLPKTVFTAATARTSTMMHTVITSDIRSLSRLVAHYNFENVLKDVDVNGSTPIHIAVKMNDVDTAQKLLLLRKIDINALELRVVGGYAAIHYACLNNSVPMLELLLQSGADVNIKCQSIIGESPLHLCCQKGLIDCAKVLMKHGASFDITDNFKNNAAFWAYKNRFVSIIPYVYPIAENLFLLNIVNRCICDVRHDVMIRELQLPAIRSATAEDLLEIMRKRVPGFTLPSLTKKKKEKKKPGK